MEEILKYLNNYFFRFAEKGQFEIIDKTIVLKGKYVIGQYILIEGSALNDGVYKIENIEDSLIKLTEGDNEVFEGIIYSLAIPKNIINLIPKIEEFKEKNNNTVLASESFGGYSYSKVTDKNGNIANWTSAFSTELKPYRKIFDNKNRVEVI